MKKKEYFLKLGEDLLTYIDHNLQLTNFSEEYEKYKNDPEYAKAYGMFLDWYEEHGQFFLLNKLGITEKKVLEPEKFWEKHQN